MAPYGLSPVAHWVVPAGQEVVESMYDVHEPSLLCEHGWFGVPTQSEHGAHGEWPDGQVWPDSYAAHWPVASMHGPLVPVAQATQLKAPLPRLTSPVAHRVWPSAQVVPLVYPWQLPWASSQGPLVPLLHPEHGVLQRKTAHKRQQRSPQKEQKHAPVRPRGASTGTHHRAVPAGQVAEAASW